MDQNKGWGNWNITHSVPFDCPPLHFQRKIKPDRVPSGLVVLSGDTTNPPSQSALYSVLLEETEYIAHCYTQKVPFLGGM